MRQRSSAARPDIRHRRPGIAAGAEQDHRAGRQPGRRRRPARSGVARRRGLAVHRVPFGELRDWHPTRREMLISTRFGNTAQVHLVRLPGGARTQLTFFPEPVAGARFEPRRPLLRVQQGRRRQRVRSALSLRLRRRRVTLLTDGSRRNTARRLVTQRRSARLRLDSPHRQRRRHLRHGFGGPEDRPAGARGLGRRLAGARLVARRYEAPRVRGHLDQREYLWLVDVATGRKTALDHPARRQWPTAAPLLARTERALPHDRRRLRVPAARLHGPRDAGSSRRSTRTDVEDFDLSHDGKTIVYVTNEKGVELYLFDTATRRELPGPEAPAGVVGGALAPEQRRHRLHDGHRALAPTPTRWTRRAGGRPLDRERARRPEPPRPSRGRAGALEELRRPRDLRLPLQAAGEVPGKRPVVIDIHGGPEGQSRPSSRTRQLLPERARRRDVFPNVRGSTGYGKTFSSSTTA